MVTRLSTEAHCSFWGIMPSPRKIVRFEDDKYADELTDRCRRNGLLVAGQSNDVLLLPALNIDRRTAARGLNILEQSVERVRSRK